MALHLASVPFHYVIAVVTVRFGPWEIALHTLLRDAGLAVFSLANMLIKDFFTLTQGPLAHLGSRGGEQLPLQLCVPQR